MYRPDICIAGAGIIGLSLALELHRRGARVTVLDQGKPLSEASTAAAGMLAASDPENPPKLRPLADLSLGLYPEFLDRIASLSGIYVPFHTCTTLQALPHGLEGVVAERNTLAPETLSLLVPQLDPGKHGFLSLAEQSLDPRELAAALLAAVRATTIDLRSDTKVLSFQPGKSKIEIHTASEVFTPERFVDCAGSWSLTADLLPYLRVTPRKGQMFAVSLPRSLPLHLVIRTPEIYIVPRTADPSTNRAVIGATIEDVGYDKTVHAADISRLHTLAANLLPPLTNVRALETWSGLRPATQDGLPILGAVPGHANLFLATGHYRNGILLAPATAHVMAQILAGEAPAADLSAFSPKRNPGKTR